MKLVVCVVVLCAPAIALAADDAFVTGLFGTNEFYGKHPVNDLVKDMAKLVTSRNHAAAGPLLSEVRGVESLANELNMDGVVDAVFGESHSVSQSSRRLLQQSFFSWRDKLSEECKDSPSWSDQLSDQRLIYSLHMKQCLQSVPVRQHPTDDEDIYVCDDCVRAYAQQCHQEGAKISSLSAYFTESIGGVVRPYAFRIYQCFPPECENDADRDVIKNGPVESLERYLGEEDNEVRVVLKEIDDYMSVGKDDLEQCHDISPTDDCKNALDALEDDPVALRAIQNYKNHRCDQIRYHNNDDNNVVYCDNGAKEYQTACLTVTDPSKPPKNNFCQFSSFFDTTQSKVHWNITSFSCLPNECNTDQNMLWFETRAKDSAKENFNLESVSDVDVDSHCGDFKFLSDACVTAEVTRRSATEPGNEDNLALREVEAKYRKHQMDCFQDALNADEDTVVRDCDESLEDYTTVCGNYDAEMCTIGMTFDENINDKDHHFDLKMHQCVLPQCQNSNDRDVIEFQNEYVLEAAFGEEENNFDFTWHCTSDIAEHASNGGASTGKKVAVVFAVLAAVLVLVGAGVFVYRKRSRFSRRYIRAGHSVLREDSVSRFSEVAEQEMSVNTSTAGRILLEDPEDIRGPPPQQRL